MYVIHCLFGVLFWGGLLLIIWTEARNIFSAGYSKRLYESSETIGAILILFGLIGSMCCKIARL